MAVKISASRLVERSITTAKRDPRSAARTLFKELLAGNEFAPLSAPIWDELAELAERATAIHMATPPTTGASALGDGWFQCPHCDDVFEGAREACAACGKRFTSAPALEVVFDDGARLWIRPSTDAALGPAQRLAFIASAFAWLRAEAGGRWFELVDDPTRVMTIVNARVALPPNLVPIGLHDDGTIVLAHETKLTLVTVDARGALGRSPDHIACAGELLARRISCVLGS